MKAAPPPQVYALEDAMEAAVSLASCCDPKFWGALGYAIDPARLRSKEAQQILTLVRGIVLGTGSAPSHVSIVSQHMANVVHAGKLELVMANQCRDYLVDALEHEVPRDELIGAVAPLIKRAHYKEVVQKATEGFAKNLPPETTAAEFEKVARIGIQATSDSGRLEDMIMDDAVLIRRDDEPLSRTGVEELDHIIGGGLERMALGLLVGGSGAGKSMALSHICATNLLDIKDVVLITLELGKVATTRRLIRNLVDMTQAELSISPALARERYRLLTEKRGLGKFRVAYMEPMATSPKDIRERINDFCREDLSFNPTVFVVDFLDKVRVNIKNKAYEDMLLVTDQLRGIAVEREGWTWTASQSTRQATGKGWLDLEAVADSMNKVRSADLVIGIGRTEEDEGNNQVRFSIPKRREGEGAHARVGPIGWDPEHGRIATVTRDFPW